MAAARASYLIVWKSSSQVYSTTSLETAIKTPIPKGCKVEDKRILLMSYVPDEEELCVYKIPQEEIDNKVQEIQIKAEEKTSKL